MPLDWIYVFKISLCHERPNYQIFDSVLPEPYKFVLLYHTFFEKQIKQTLFEH